MSKPMNFSTAINAETMSRPMSLRSALNYSKKNSIKKKSMKSPKTIKRTKRNWRNLIRLKLINLTTSGIKNFKNLIPTRKISKRKCNKSTTKKYKMPKRIFKSKRPANSKNLQSVSISEKYKNR
jgi:hypothetical protein